MSAVATVPGPMALRRPSLARLTHVELRKMTDTRAGFWLLVAMVLLTAAAAIARVVSGDVTDRTFSDAFSISLFPTAVLLPVLGILSVTSEWSQRTALTTFALITQRWRIIAAKALASVALCVGAVVVCLGFAAIANVIGTVAFDGDGSWSLPTEAIGDAFVYQVLGMMGGLAFGMAFLASAPAIVLYFALPTVWSLLGELISGLENVSRWLDMSRTMEPLMEFEMSGTAWARIAVSGLLWIGLPLAIGLWRVVRREVS
jgi:ABC-2 type transport system permease protein